MKRIKLRFIKIEDKWQVQKKGFFYGWKTIGYEVGGGAGDSVWYPYENKDKNTLLEEVIDKHYRTCKKYVWIEEHPTIYKY